MLASRNCTKEMIGEECYDPDGAVLFICVVLSIYGSSIFIFIAYSVKSSVNKRQGQIDREIEKYLVSKFDGYREIHIKEVSVTGGWLFSV